MRYRNFYKGRRSFIHRFPAVLSKGINTTVSLAKHARLDMGSLELDEVVRASVHYYNTEEEIERFCEVLAHC